jgi:putative FmdB family regulatory protein
MPTYDYKCLDCTITFEEFQKMSDEPLQICPKCEGKLKRLIGAGVAPIFKGSGFYQTDYKNNSSSKKNVKSSTKTEKKEAPNKKETKIDKSVK